MPKGVKTQKTGLYFENVDAVSKLGGLTDFNGLGGQKGEIDATNLDSDAKEFFTGLEDSGTFSCNLNLDPNDATQQAVFDIKDSGEVVTWALCLSDGTTAPTIETDEFTAPVGRTAFIFDASVQQFSVSGAADNIVKGAISLRITGPITRAWKTPAP
jgi:hypothetical protein